MSIFQYISESKDKSYLAVNGVEFEEIDELPPTISLKQIVSRIRKILPYHYFQDLEKVVVQHLEEFNDRHITAIYKDGIFYITNKQEDIEDILDDVVHEFAHHVETLFKDEIYSGGEVSKEFLKKRAQLEFELKSEGYWTDDYNFKNINYNNELDDFLYKRVGRNMMKMLTTGLFMRPYSSISLREYFATGFEAYYLGKKEELQKISPVLYKVIDDLHNMVTTD
jgi:hypothetical protein